MEPKALIAQLRLARLEDNLTYRDLAAILEIAPSAVHRLLKARVPQPNDRTRFRIERYLASRRSAGVVAR